VADGKGMPVIQDREEHLYLRVIGTDRSLLGRTVIAPIVEIRR
jgi:hypothetical protein